MYTETIFVFPCLYVSVSLPLSISVISVYLASSISLSLCLGPSVLYLASPISLLLCLLSSILYLCILSSSFSISLFVSLSSVFNHLSSISVPMSSIFAPSISLSLFFAPSVLLPLLSHSIVLVFPLTELNLTGYCNVTDVGIQYVSRMITYVSV